jgi:hypothetical protein
MTVALLAVVLCCIFAFGVLLGALLRMSLGRKHQSPVRKMPEDLLAPSGLIDVLLVGTAPKLAAACSLALAIFLTRTMASQPFVFVRVLFAWFFLWMCLFCFLRAAAWSFGFSTARQQRGSRPSTSAVWQLVAEFSPLSAGLIAPPILLFLLPLTPGLSMVLPHHNPVSIIAYSGAGFGVRIFLFVLGLSLVGLSWNGSYFRGLCDGSILPDRLRKVVELWLLLAVALFLVAASNILSLEWFSLIFVGGGPIMAFVCGLACRRLSFSNS